MTQAARLWGRQVLGHAQAPLFSNAYYLILTSLVPSATGFVYWTLAARLIAADRVGIGSALLSTPAVLVLLFGLDLGTGLVRFVPLSLNQSPERINTAIWFRIISAILASGTFLLGVTIWSPALGFLRANVAASAAFILSNIVLSVNELLDHAFVAYRSARFAFWKNLIVSVGRFPVLFGLVASWKAAGGFEILLSVVIPAAIANAVAIVWFLPRAFPAYRLRWHMRSTLWFDMARFSLASYGATMLLQLPSLIIPILVINVLGPVPAGVAYIVSNLAWTVLLIPTAVSRSLLAEGAHKIENLPQLTRRALVFSLGLMSLPTASFMILGPVALQVLFGSTYRQQGGGLLLLLSLSALPGGLIAIYATLQRVRNQLRPLIWVAGIVCLVSLSAAGWLMPRWGLDGLGVGLLIGQLSGAALAAREISRITHRAGAVGQPTDYSSLKKTLDCIIDDVAPQLSAAPRLLDVGCGTGTLANQLGIRLNGQSYGIDIDRQALRIASTQYPHRSSGFIHYDGYQLPFAGDHFDLIVLHEVIEHISDPLRLLANLYVVAARNGRLIITTPNAILQPLSSRSHPAHVRHYSPIELQQIAESAGWCIMEQCYRYHPISAGLDFLLLYAAQHVLPIENVQPHMATLRQPEAQPLLQFYHDWVDPIVTWAEQTEFRLRRDSPAPNQVLVCRK